MTDENRPYYGRDRRESRERRTSRPADRRRVQSLLPHPSTLEQYEQISPGSSGRIIHLAEKELEQRHEWEDKYLYEYMRLHRLGQTFGFFISFFTIATSFYLFLEKEFWSATVIAIGSFGSLIVATIVSSLRKKFEKKHRPKKYNNGRNNHTAD
jgi:uncharacterized membrane protein